MGERSTGTSDDRTITQSPEAERPDTRVGAREDAIEDGAGADGIEVERQTQQETSPQRQDDSTQQQEGIEVEPAQ